MPKVSVLLPFRDAAPTLDAAITSITTQTFTGWELLLIDNASTDESTAITVSYLYRMKTYAVRVKSKMAEALIEQLAALGVIEAEAMKKPYEHLADVMLAIRTQVKEKVTVQAVIEEVDAVRAKRYAASKKAQARR